nr:hypothetical protein [Candidatus Electrothrix aestuarii]
MLKGKFYNFLYNEKLDIRPEQYGLTRQELAALLTLRNLINNSPENVDDQDWEQIQHILIQVEKRRYLYPAWCAEEAEQQLTLSPDFFRNPSEPALRFVKPTERSEELLAWRDNPAFLRSWRARLQGRFDQQAGLSEALYKTVERIEQEVLPSLRDGLIDLLYEDATGMDREDNKQKATNELLINAFENGCRKQPVQPRLLRRSSCWCGDSQRTI